MDNGLDTTPFCLARQRTHSRALLQLVTYLGGHDMSYLYKQYGQIRLPHSRATYITPIGTRCRHLRTVAQLSSARYSVVSAAANASKRQRLSFALNASEDISYLACNHKKARGQGVRRRQSLLECLETTKNFTARCGPRRWRAPAQLLQTTHSCSRAPPEHSPRALEKRRGRTTSRANY